MVLYRGGTFGCAAQLHGHAYRGPVYINAPADSPVRTTLRRHGRLARPPSPPVQASVLVYNAEDNLLVRTGLQRRGRLIYLLPRPTRLSARLTMLRPTHASAMSFKCHVSFMQGNGSLQERWPCHVARRTRVPAAASAAQFPSTRWLTCRFTRPHQLTTRRTTCSSAPVYKTSADSFVYIHSRLARDWF